LLHIEENATMLKMLQCWQTRNWGYIEK